MQSEISMVNALLKVIGESPINQIDLSNPDVQAALGIWEELSSEVQSMGWWYNTETWDLQVQTDGTVTLPSNTVAIVPDDPMYIKRGRKLYNKETHSFDFSDEESVEVELISVWAIDEMPPTVYNYILARARTKMLVDYAMDVNKLQRYISEESTAFHLLQSQHLRFSNVSATQANTAALLLARKTPRYYAVQRGN